MNINYLKTSFTIEAIDSLMLPYFKGSTFRGGFGNAFRRVVCALKKKDCKECLLKTRCIYAYIFETAPPEGTQIMGMAKYITIPHPFIIEPPEDTGKKFNPGEELAFSLILIGRAVEYLPYFIYTFNELGRIGIGKGRGRYTLKTVKSQKGSGEIRLYSAQDGAIKSVETEKLHIPEEYVFTDMAETQLTLNFITPVRMQHGRDLTVVPEFYIVIKNLMRRLNLLYYFHCGKKEAKWDHKNLLQEAEKVIIKDNNLKWWDWERYSSRQDVRIKMGGLKGEITYTGNIAPFMPILMAGQVLHIGKGTSFGLGRYVIKQ